MEKDYIDTGQITLCQRCQCMTKILMDVDGDKYCGKCKERK